MQLSICVDYEFTMIYSKLDSNAALSFISQRLHTKSTNEKSGELLIALEMDALIIDSIY